MEADIFATSSEFHRVVAKDFLLDFACTATSSLVVKVMRNTTIERIIQEYGGNKL